MIDFKDVSNCLAKLILTRNSSSLIASLVSCQVRYIKVLIQKDISGYIHAPMVGKLLVKYICPKCRLESLGDGIWTCSNCGYADALAHQDQQNTREYNVDLNLLSIAKSLSPSDTASAIAGVSKNNLAVKERSKPRLEADDSIQNSFARRTQA